MKNVERELSDMSKKMQQESENKLRSNETSKRNEAKLKENEIQQSALSDDDKERLLKEHKAHVEEMEVTLSVQH